jgi:hypothetical protein
MSNSAIQLERNAFGQLQLIAADGQRHRVTPVRAFPIAAPDEGIALIAEGGEELAWVARLDEQPEPIRTLIAEDLANREFLPEIRRIRHVSSYATPSTWDVDTDRGAASLVLKSEEDIRRLTSPALMIADSRGIHFLIRDRYALDPASKRLLDRFL